MNNNSHFLLIFAFLLLSVSLAAQSPFIIRSDVSIQKQLQKKEAVYLIRNEIDLKGETVSIPLNCTLRFDGGAMKNGTLIYNNTYIEGNYKLYCKCRGTVANNIVEPHMYGARGDAKSDDTNAIQQSINSGKQVLFRRGTYLTSAPIVFDRQNFIVDFNFATIKKTGNKGYNYIYDSFDFNRIPCVFLIKPYKSNTSGHIVVRNLILDGDKNNIGIHAIWCRNVILDNIRILNTTKGFVYNGFTNTFRDITIWDSSEGFLVTGGNATLFERCFTSHCGWSINTATAITLQSCSSDDFNPCYSISNSTVSMIGCTHESKGLGISIKNSILELSGDFESHIYDSTKVITYIKASESSIIYGKGCTFHLNNYLKKNVPDSNLFEVYDNSMIELDGRIVHGSGVKIYKSVNGKMTINGYILNNGKNQI